MSTLSVTVVIACEAAAFSACTLNQDVPSASVIWTCPRTLLQSVWVLFDVALQLNPADECLYFSLLSPLTVMPVVGN